MKPLLLLLTFVSLYAQTPKAIHAVLAHGAIATCNAHEDVELVAKADNGKHFLLKALPNCAISRFDVRVIQNAAIKNAPTYHVVSSDGFNGLNATLHPIDGCNAQHSSDPQKCQYLQSAPDEKIIIYLHQP